MNEDNTEIDLTKVDISCDYQSDAKLRKYDLICFQIIEKNIRQVLQEAKLQDIIRMITIASEGESISIIKLNFILKQLFSQYKAEAILEWIILSFFFLDKGKDSSALQEKESYEVYLEFNLKLIISKELDCFSFSALFGDTENKRGSPRHNLDNLARIYRIDLISVILFFIFFGTESNEKKTEMLFDILDYDKNGQLRTGKKLFYVIFRKMVLLTLFYSDILTNYSIHKHSAYPNIFSVVDKDNVTTEGTPEPNSGTRPPIFNEEKLIFYQTYTDLVFEYKKILFYLRHSKGVMKDLVTFISHSFVFYENKTNPLVSRNLFMTLCKDSNYSIFTPGIYREYLIKFLFHNQKRSTLFFGEFPKMIHYLEEKLIHGKKNVKREQNLVINELNLKEEYNKYELILEDNENIIIKFINTEKYINKKDLNDLKRQKYKKQNKITKRELDKEITEINEKKDLRESQVPVSVKKSNDSEDMEDDDDELLGIKTIKKTKSTMMIEREKEENDKKENDKKENDKKEKELLKLGFNHPEVIDEEDIVENNETITISSHYDMEVIQGKNNQIDNEELISPRPVRTESEQFSEILKQRKIVLNSDDDSFEDAKFSGEKADKLLKFGDDANSSKDENVFSDIEIISNNKKNKKNNQNVIKKVMELPNRLSATSNLFQSNEEYMQNRNDEKRKTGLIRQGDVALEEIPKNDEYNDANSDNRSIINLTSQLDTQMNNKHDKLDKEIMLNSNQKPMPNEYEVEADIIFNDYFSSFESFKKTPIDQIQGSMKGINDSLITQCDINKFTQYFKQFSKNQIYAIINCQINENLMNLYFTLMTFYNIFLRNSGEIDLKIIFFDTNFFQLLQDSCHLNSFSSLYKKYQSDFFNNNGTELIFDDDEYLIVVPIYVYVNLANSDTKKLFMASINMGKRLITFYDSDDILTDNHEVVNNYRILFETFFSFLMKENISKKDLTGWECESDSIDSMCYEDDYAEIIMIYYTQLICKTGKIRLISDKEYVTIRDTVFKEIAGFFIKLYQHIS